MIKKIVSVILVMMFAFTVSSGVFAAETAIKPDTSEEESIIISNQECKVRTVTFEYSSEKLEVGDDITVMFYKPVGPDGDCIIYKADGQLTTDDLSNIYYIDQFEVKEDKKIQFAIPKDVEEGTYNLMVGGTDINSPTVAKVDVPKAYKLGDVTDDGFIRTNDLTKVVKHLADLEEIEENTTAFFAADINKDGFIRTNDSSKLLQYLADIIDTLE